MALDDELIEEGYIREIISKIQTMRKESNFNVVDRIDIYVSNNKKIEEIVNKHKDILLRDIMAKNVFVGVSDSNAILREWDINDEKVTIAIKK